ncbi:MAG TPA: hypothetical protein VGO86_09480 [Candidatus Dormibacteraeota bacterium]
MTRNEQLLESALASRHPERALWDMAAHLLETGTSHAKLLAELEALMLRLRREGREADEDRVLDVMDCVTGWCRPAWSLASRRR